MDQTKRPFTIPPEFLPYVEKHKIFEICQKLVEKLIITLPDDPLTFLIHTLEMNNHDAVKVHVLGPPASGKATIAKILAERVKCPLLTFDNVLQNADLKLKNEIETFLNKNMSVPDQLSLKMFQQRMAEYDCEKNGWILVDFPQSSQQASLCKKSGILPTHVVMLNAPVDVLFERASGKRVDAETKDIYHVTFHPPPESGELLSQLLMPDNCSQLQVMQRNENFERFRHGLVACYGSMLKEFNADQPVSDLFAQVADFVRERARTYAPHNPRIVLLGPPGSGKSVQASLLSKKYAFKNVHCGTLIREEIAANGSVGKTILQCLDRGMSIPDTIVLKIVTAKLSGMKFGWILHGFPRTQRQAELLDNAGFGPSRVFYLDIPTYTVLERICNQQVDPVTGERFHAVHYPATDDVQASRLMIDTKHSQERTEQRLQRHAAEIADILKYYTALSQSIAADQDVYMVFEMLESLLVNPIARKF